MMRHFAIALFVMLTVVQNALAQASGTLDIKTSTGTTRLYSGSYALVVSMGKYKNWGTLSSTAKESDEISEELQRHGFKVVRYSDLGGRELRDAIDDFVAKFGYEKGNRLVFYFSGHGHSRGESGYFVPIDAADPTLNEAQFLAKALSMHDVMSVARKIEAKHALFLFDSCFSGTLFKTRALPRANDTYVRESANRPVRQFITAGDANEEVPAQSIFSTLLIRGLRGEADLMKSGFITGSALAVYLTQSVPQYSEQHPQYGKIRDPKLDEGDIVFALNSVTAPPSNGGTSQSADKAQRISHFINTVGNAVFFDYDSIVLRADAKAALDQGVKLLLDNPDIEVTIEGHTETSAGLSREQAIATGLRRANSVREYMISRNVPASRINIISYGRERPVCPNESPACDSQNRRAVLAFK